MPVMREPDAPSQSPCLGRRGRRTEGGNTLPMFLTTAEIQGFRDLNIELQIELSNGEHVFIVADRSELDRREITLDELDAMAGIIAAFPGARILEFQTSERPDITSTKGTSTNHHTIRRHRRDAPRFENPPISVSRVQRWEGCPKAFELAHIRRHDGEWSEAPAFGRAVHRTLERLVNEHVHAEVDGPLSAERGRAIWSDEWSRSALTGVGLFDEGARIVRDFIDRQGPLDSLDVLAVEERFEITVDGRTVVGVLDRVDHVDDETVEIIDYKANRRLYSQHDLEADLQLSVYAAAARILWPWAKTVRLSYWLLRHGVKQPVTRSEGQAEAALKYLVATARQIDEAEDYPARLGPNCQWCNWRAHCDAYQAALADRSEVAAELPDVLEDVCAEREAVATRIKILNDRKRQLESIIRARLKEDDEVIGAGTRYQLYRTTSLHYPLGPTLDLLERLGQVDYSVALEGIAVVDKKALETFVGSLDLSRANRTLLKAELNAIADKTFGSRFWAKPIKERELE